MLNSVKWDIFMKWNAQMGEPYPLSMTTPNQICIYRC